MKKALRPMVFAALVLLPGFSVSASAQETISYYVCNCKDDCECNTISKSPGKCSCGDELVAMHLLMIENGTAIFCRCGGECTCERSKDDPEKCGCGKPVKKVSLKGKYICQCGPACKCNTISDKPGKCSCGQELKLVR
ncbi:MAG: hypothetical protein ACE148_10095 [Vicinamibacterales bacterium]